MRKGIYPYSWVNSWKKFDETKLPPTKAFFYDLNNSTISDKDQEHPQKVWKAFDCDTFKKYSMLHNTLDVLLLADVFEQFRKTIISEYELDPANYLTLPGLGWSAMIKITGVKLEQQNKS